MSSPERTENDKELFYRYWGKAGKDDGSFHLLPYHCLDVAAVGHVLLTKDHRLRQKLSRLSGMEEELFMRWAVFFLALHDLGKFADSFQNLLPDLLQQLQHRDSSRCYTERHDTLGYLLWRSHIRNLFQQAGILSAPQSVYDIPPELEATNFWMRAVTGHHGLPPKTEDHLLRNHFREPEDIEAAKAFVTELFGLLLGENKTFPALTPDVLKSATWWLAGFTVQCDWLGSGLEPARYRTTQIPLADYWATALKWAEEKVTYSGLLPAKVTDTPPHLDNLFTGSCATPIDPTPLQKKATDLPLGKGPQLFILEDVTGAGKTEAALLLANRIMASGLATGIYFGLPTMATSNAMFKRVGGIYQSLYRAGENPSLVLAHGARDLNPEFCRSIIPADSPEQIEREEGALSAASHCTAWLADNRKKALLAEVGIGTIDQALLGVLPSRHQSLRLLGLLSKVLIMDEVHACDAYMNRLLCGLLNAHAASGGSAILLSATLPQNQREKLVESFARGLKADPPELKKSENTAYPLLTHYQSERAEEHRVGTRKSVERRVEIQLRHTEEDIFKLIADTVSTGRCICWIRNTVADARDAWKELQTRLPAVMAELFHARFAMADRLEIETRVLDRFGPESTPDKRRNRVLIATQVVEQSLDLDFDLLITDLAPIDLIIQRAGRLQRHRRTRDGLRTEEADGRGVPLLTIHCPPWRDEPATNWLRDPMPGTAAVYREQDGLLWLGLRQLKSGAFRMPDDARTLVEEVYGDAALDRIPEGLRESTLTGEGAQLSNASLAKANLLKLELGYQREESNVWWDEALTPTRLGEESSSIYLARWDGNHLTPWAEEGEKRWAQSAVALRKALIADEAAHAEIPERLITAAREGLPAKGKWGVLLPLMQQENGVWQGWAKNGKDEEVAVYYDRKKGLMMEKEVKEMVS